MEDIETMIETMITLYRLKLNDTAMHCGFTAPETVTCSQELDKWILLAIGKRYHKQLNKKKLHAVRA
ncbi:aspartyl-phosphate phosphatase Spo0E family protein [Bacillus sp. AFS096315]|uniref:aspartyl-phosphate phosphatase Spo0E family protein n=1 Tax=Bacillus sp. AFS096315 TaxID=2033517 RepID=UPI000BEC0147|nr:aspartyl-phosphate phosphatase Spo0E family protein [Bacillus sp. AFS096315]PEC50132.1 Spo0E family sporulation regulatory protein-aspartic acid phosphatase [Bacillus sp. AFS096315]